MRKPNQPRTPAGQRFGRLPGRRNAWDHAPDRGDFDDMGRDIESSRYHYSQKRSKGRF